MYETMNERHGIVVYFGQKGNLGSTANWLTLLVASFATIAVLNNKINQMVTGVATSQLAYTGAVFLTKPEDDYMYKVRVHTSLLLRLLPLLLPPPPLPPLLLLLLLRRS